MSHRIQQTDDLWVLHILIFTERNRFFFQNNSFYDNGFDRHELMPSGIICSHYCRLDNKRNVLFENLLYSLNIFLILIINFSTYLTSVNQISGFRNDN